MFRTIAAAAIVFAFSAFALHRVPAATPFEEPILLLIMGTLFLIVGKLVSGEGRGDAAPVLAERNAHA